MKAIVIAGVLLALAGSASAQISFDEHYAQAKAGKPGARETAFAKLCGVDRSAAKVTYGYSVDEGFNLKPIATVPGTDLAQIDNFGTAELWSVDGKPRLLNVWNMIMDTGNYQNDFFCLDANGKVTAEETLNTYEPPDSPSKAWRHLERVTFAADGKKTVIKSVFVSKTGATIAPLKLGKDDKFMATDMMMVDNVPQMIQQISGGAK